MDNSVLGLENKVAVVSGGGGGMGKASAILLAKAGARVVIAEVNAEKGAEAQKELEQLGGQAIFVQADSRLPKDVERVVTAALERFGRIDIGINIVGGGSGSKPTMETSEDVFQSVFTLNVISTLLCSKAYARAMIQGKHGGAIVNMAALAATHAPTGGGPYGVAKAGVMSLTQTLAVELAPYDIRVNAVAPGFIASNPWSWNNTAEGTRLVKKSVPMGRSGLASDVAGVIIALVSPLSGYVTGQTVVIDGGHLSPIPLMSDPDWQRMMQTR